MRSILVMISGVVMLLSSVAHGGLGWPAMRAELGSTTAPADLVQGLGAGWYFGTASMAAFGSIVLFCGLRMRRGDLSGVPVVGIVAVCYVVFGLLATLLVHLNAHFALFVATGLLAGLPLLGIGRR